jgi:hypothetical protein
MNFRVIFFDSSLTALEILNFFNEVLIKEQDLSGLLSSYFERRGFEKNFNFRKAEFIIVALLIITVSFYQTSLAAQIRLAWDPNTESDLAGYKVYYGKSSNLIVV